MRTTLLTILAWLALTAARAQYAIDWYKVAGGGGSSTGGVYVVTGTMGQHDADASSGTGFSLTGGFWALVALPSPGAPALTILRTSATTVTVSWPSPSAGFGLQQNPGLDPVNWANCPLAINDNGTNKWVVVSPPVGQLFYRLRK